MPVRPWLAAAALAGVVFASCTSGDDGDAAARTGRAPDPVDRLLVLGDDGNVFTIDPAGEDRVEITDDATSDLRYAQPTWSPDAARIAFARTDVGGRAPEAALVTTQADGAARVEASTPAPPFYIHWSPDGDRLVFLANGRDGLDLRLVDVGAGDATAETIATGSPFYLSWAADGAELVTHVGAGTAGLLGRLDTDGKAEPLPGAPGAFQAPQWSPTGDRLVYALADGRDQRLVVADVEGEVVEEVARFDGVVSFALDPGGERLAYTVRDVDDGSDDGELVDVVGASAGQPPERAEPDVLVVAELETGERQAVADGPVALLQWSPDGAALLFATVEVAGGASWLRWQVWDGEETLRFDRARPTATFVSQYLPFFDQFSRSLTLWAPAGDAFTYPGRDDDGADAVWVQPVEPDHPPVRVSAGRFASWSPR